MLKPARYNITVWRSATFRQTATLFTDDGSTPWDLTGYSGQLVVKDSQGNILLTLNNTNGGLILGGTAGTIQIYISATDTGNITWNSGSYLLEITAPSGGDTTLLLHGTMNAVNP